MTKLTRITMSNHSITGLNYKEFPCFSQKNEDGRFDHGS